MKQVGEIVAGGELSSASGQRHGEARLPHLIAQESPRTQERYLEFFAVTIRNPHTRRAYVAAASRFFAWVETRAPRLASVTPMLVAAYIESHPGEALTIRQHLAALRRLFDWLVTGGILPNSPVTSVRGPRMNRQVGKTPVMTGAAAAAVITAAASPTLAGLRDQALLSIMLLSFTRVGALVTLPRSAYSAATQDGSASLRIREKGSQERLIPLHKEAAAALDAWLTAAGPAAPHDPLFPAIDHATYALTSRPLTTRLALKRVKRAAALAGQGGSICSHSFRATGITLFRAAGGSLEHAQQLAGHASSETTRLYDRSDTKICADELEKRLSRT